MNSKELKLVIEQISLEKDLEKSKVVAVVQSALEAVYRKIHRHLYDIRIDLDTDSADYTCYRRWQVIDDCEEELEDDLQQVFLKDLSEENKDLEVGDFVEEELEKVEFGRILAQQARQVIMQKFREEEKLKIVEMYKDRVGTVIQGEISRLEREKVHVDLGNNVELVILKFDLIPIEKLRVKDRIRVYLKEVKIDFRGPCLIGSRTSPDFLTKLFEIEVPEINQGLISVVGTARDPGIRAKLAVRSNEAKLEPVGACVGMRGQRVQSVSNELAGERVDIILWNENPAQFVINAMAPADVKNILIDEDNNTMILSVASDKLAQAIGKNGQNVKLASELTGWKITVMDEHEHEQQVANENKRLIELFNTTLQVSDEVAGILVEEGYSSVEDVAFVSEESFNAITDLDDTLKSEILKRANDYLLKNALTTEEEEENISGDSDLNQLEGIDDNTLDTLEKNGVKVIIDLADLSTDEFLDICTTHNREQASLLIMQARKFAYKISTQ